MPNITLRKRIIIDSTSNNQKAMQFLLNAKPFLQQDIPHRIWSINSSMNWNDIMAAYPQQVREIHEELTQMGSFYLKTLTPRLPNLLERHQIIFRSFEVEIINFDVANADSLELAVYFFSEKYRLIRDFGVNLLLSQIEKNELAAQETFVIQLNLDLSIHTYEI